MKQIKNFKTQDRWQTLVNTMTLMFGNGKELDTQAILFLIGINELGKGYKTFTKDEKLNLLHIAICRLLSNYGYYKYVGRDNEGWPHWKTNTNLPKLKPEEQDVLIKQAAVLYFEEAGIEF